VRVLSIGEVLWDVFKEREFLGGAPLNFSVSAQRLGNVVVLLSAVGNDTRGNLAIASMRELGLSTDCIQMTSSAATGAAVVTHGGEHTTFVIDRPAAFDFVHIDDSLIAQIRHLYPDWIYFGTLAHTTGEAEQRLNRLINAIPHASCFYDINLREGHWNLPLVQRLSRLARIIKLNEAEAEILFHDAKGPGVFSVETFCSYWSSAYGGEIFCVTLGSKGCAVWQKYKLWTFSGFPVSVADTVGAGDAFAAAFLHGYQNKWPLDKTATIANALGAIVASRSGATPAWTLDECLQLIASAPSKHTE
jgi:fructokinase